MYNEYVPGIPGEAIGQSFEEDITELDFYQNIRNGINYFIQVNEEGLPILICSHRIVQVEDVNIAFGDYFWIRPEYRGNIIFMQESMELFKLAADSSIIISKALGAYAETFRFVYNATNLQEGVFLV